MLIETEYNIFTEKCKTCKKLFLIIYWLAVLRSV